MNTQTHKNRIKAHGFTLIELLVVISIIALLIGLLGVAFSGALTTGKKAATQSLLHNIQTGVQQFKTDFGYLPPLIDGEKQSLEVQEVGQDAAGLQQELKDHRYYSPYSLTIFLLGVGEVAPYEDLQPDEKVDRHDGKQGPGFRDPGPDHFWGGARDSANHRAPATGRVYGPYIDIGDGEGVLRRAEMSDFTLPPSGDPMDFFPNDPNDTDPRADLFVLTDRWGQAIRYYKDWPKRTLDTSGNPVASIDKIPVELRSKESLLQSLTAPMPAVPYGDPLLDPALLRAPYALLSAGPDADFGETDVSDEWIDSETFFDGAGTADPDKLSVIDRIADNIRTTP